MAVGSAGTSIRKTAAGRPGVLPADGATGPGLPSRFDAVVGGPAGFEVPCRQAIGLARDLRNAFDATRQIDVAIVHRLEAAFAAATREVDAAGGERGARLHAALVQMVHIAQVSREWQRTVDTLRQNLDDKTTTGGDRVEAGRAIADLEQFVTQNMADLTRWLRASERLRAG